MDKILRRHIVKIRKHVTSKEGLDEIEKAFEDYATYKQNKILKNNKRLVKMYTQKLYDEFNRLTTHSISNKKDIWK